MQETYKIAINNCYGGFSLSKEGTEMLNELKGYSKKDKEWLDPKYGYFEGDRSDVDLIKVIETLKKGANGDHSELVIIEIAQPLYLVREYDGNEWLEEPQDIKWDIVRTPKSEVDFPEYFL